MDTFLTHCALGDKTTGLQGAESSISPQAQLQQWSGERGFVTMDEKARSRLLPTAFQVQIQDANLYLALN